MECMDFLKACCVEGNIVRFPQDIQLDRNIYKQVEQKLKGIGGKWNRKEKGFSFPHNPQEDFNKILGGERVNHQKDLQAFFTPPELAKRMVDLLAIEEGDEILEPSAGTGNLLDAIDPRIRSKCKIHCCEIHESFQNILEGKGYTVFKEDFLTFDRGCLEWNKILANPPFTKGSDIDHFNKMLECLESGGRLVCLMSPSWQHNRNKKQAAFREWIEKNEQDGFVEIFEIEAGTFKQSGTMIRSVLVVYDKP